MKKLECKKIAITSSPVEVARQLSHLDGLVFIDSSGNLSELDVDPISIVVADPVKVIKGSIIDFL